MVINGKAWVQYQLVLVGYTEHEAISYADDLCGDLFSRGINDAEAYILEHKEAGTDIRTLPIGGSAKEHVHAIINWNKIND